jgi:hypothetical protein
MLRGCRDCNDADYEGRKQAMLKPHSTVWNDWASGV